MSSEEDAGKNSSDEGEMELQALSLTDILTEEDGAPSAPTSPVQRSSVDDSNSSTSNPGIQPVIVGTSSIPDMPADAPKPVSSGKAVKRSRNKAKEYGARKTRISKVDRALVDIKKGLYGGPDKAGLKRAAPPSSSSSSSAEASGAASPAPSEDDAPSAPSLAAAKKHRSSKREKAAFRNIKGLLNDEQSKFLTDFNPRNSARNRRKKAGIEYFDTSKPKAALETLVHDGRGHFVAADRTTHDLCDCLQPRCPGCHFPCPRCRSTRCGQECRVNRKWFYERIDVEGTEQFYVNARFKQQG